MTTILAVIMALLRIFVPIAIEQGQPRAEESQRRPELRARLRKKIRIHRGRDLALVLLSLIVLSSGCGRVVYVPHGEPVRIAETVEDVAIWTVDADGDSVQGKIDLPEGRWCLPDPGDDEDGD